MSKHKLFILTPITSVIEEMITATSSISAGIESYPVWDYIVQATFTKMTGFQEQKMKCIDWELATNGYEYRRLFLDDVKNRGTYSTYDSKRKVYNALLSEIARYSKKEKSDIVTQMKTGCAIDPIRSVRNLLDDTNISAYKQREYQSFSQSRINIATQIWIVPGSSDNNVHFFESILRKHYEELYFQRNRIVILSPLEHHQFAFEHRRFATSVPIP